MLINNYLQTSSIGQMVAFCTKTWVVVVIQLRIVFRFVTMLVSPYNTNKFRPLDKKWTFRILGSECNEKVFYNNFRWLVTFRWLRLNEATSWEIVLIEFRFEAKSCQIICSSCLVSWQVSSRLGISCLMFTWLVLVGWLKHVSLNGFIETIDTPNQIPENEWILRIININDYESNTKLT